MVSLCKNCDNMPGCNLRNGHAVMFCEEHTTKPAKEVLSTSNFEQLYAAEGMVFTHFEGLCGHCDIKDKCIWRVPETIVYNCEHYL